MSFIKRYPFIELPIEPDKAFPERKKSPPTPIIPIKLSNGKNDSPIILPLVDSGSQYCYFDSELLHFLDLKKEDGTKSKVTGIGNATVTAYFFNIKIKLLDPQSRETIYEFSCHAGFTESKILYGGLLGINGFFENSRIYFNIPDGYFEIHKT